ncbi:MAG TPA: ABC transporter permease, partial [Bacillota bacterium]|nr:ABC transporter permease [Bacillota bacterium]
EMLSGHAILTYLAFILVVVIRVFLYKTPLGLKMRAVGENPSAASSVGVSVLKMKYIAIAMSGALAGFGGAFMSMYYSQGWNQGMVAGRGFIALAAQAMGRGEPVGAMFSSLLFGLAQAMKTKVSGLRGIASYNYLIEMIPYVVTIIGLVVYAISIKRRARRHQLKPVKE